MTITGNTLLDRLPANVLDRLAPDLKRVHIERHQILHHPGERIEVLYFPLTCMISITITMQDGRTVETDAIGSREVVGINAFMGGRATTDTAYVGQLPGEAIKIAAAPLKEEFDRNTALRSILMRYTQAMIAHVSQNAACNRLHHLEARCSRWLLEVTDRVRSHVFPLTHEFIAEMLGTSRVSVSLAMSNLKKAGVISYSRGSIRIIDPQTLLKTSCECYALLQLEYDRLLGVNEPKA